MFSGIWRLYLGLDNGCGGEGLMDVVFKFEVDDDYPIPKNGIICNMKEYRYTFWDSQLKLLPNFIN